MRIASLRRTTVRAESAAARRSNAAPATEILITHLDRIALAT